MQFTLDRETGRPARRASLSRTWFGAPAHGCADAAAIDKAIKAARRKQSKRKPKPAAKGDGPAAEAS